jgi:hypothetical protein
VAGFFTAFVALFDVASFVDRLLVDVFALFAEPAPMLCRVREVFAAAGVFSRFADECFVDVPLDLLLSLPESMEIGLLLFLIVSYRS